MDRPTKVGKLELVVESKKKIFWLDVTMNDMLVVAVVECTCKLVDPDGSFTFGKTFFNAQVSFVSLDCTCQNFVHFTTMSVLDNQVDAIFVPKISVQ